MKDGASRWTSAQNVISIVQLAILAVGSLCTAYYFLAIDGPSKMQFDHEIEISELGSTEGGTKNLYLVEYNYDITNKGILPMDISYVVLYAFVDDIEPIGEDDSFSIVSRCSWGGAYALT